MKCFEEALILAIEACDYKPYYNYSGCGMYGTTCFGIVGSDSGCKILMNILNELKCTVRTNGNHLDEAIESFENVCTDSMGYDTIVYFPRFQMEQFIDDEDVN